MAFAGIEGAICCDAGDLLTWRDLVQQLGQHGRITHVAGGELGSPDFQRFLFDPDMDLAPNPVFGAPALAGVSFPFALDLDPGAVDQEVQRAVRTAVGDIHLLGLLPPRHREQHFNGKAGLDHGVAIGGLSAALSSRRGFSGNGVIEPDRQRTPALQRLVVGRPVPGLVGRGLLMPTSCHAGFTR